MRSYTTYSKKLVLISQKTNCDEKYPWETYVFKGVKYKEEWHKQFITIIKSKSKKQGIELAKHFHEEY